MAEPCAIPGGIPTAMQAPIRGLTGLFLRIIRKGEPESTKRALAMLGGATLCLCTYGLTLAVIYQAASRGAVDSQLVLALLGALGSVAALAGVAYRKPDSTGGAS